MIRVVGAVVEIVPLRDLDDQVFYKQEKTYSEAEYEKSNDLKREIKRGRLRVISRTNEKFSDFQTPESSTNPSNLAPGPIKSSTDVQALIQQVEKLESKIKEQKPETYSLPENPLLLKLVEKIEALEGRLTQTTQADNTELLEAVKRLEARVNKNEDTGLLDKLEKMLSQSQQNVAIKPKQEKDDKQIDQEVYIPKIRVEDGSSHINLQTRSIERGTGVDSAAEALKKLRGGK